MLHDAQFALHIKYHPFRVPTFGCQAANHNIKIEKIGRKPMEQVNPENCRCILPFRAPSLTSRLDMQSHRSILQLGIVKGRENIEWSTLFVGHW